MVKHSSAGRPAKATRPLPFNSSAKTSGQDNPGSLEVQQSNQLPALAADIVGQYAAVRHSAHAAAVVAVRLGEALAEAKAIVGHGQWSAWLETNCHLSDRSARRYLRLAELGLNPATVADLGLVGALAPLSKLRFPKASELVVGSDGAGWRWVLWEASVSGGPWYHVWAFHYDRSEDCVSVKPFAKRALIGQLESFGLDLASLQFDPPAPEVDRWFRENRADMLRESHPLWATVQ